MRRALRGVLLAGLLAACGLHQGCAGRISETPWEEARRRGVDFRAVGQEPGWLVEIGNGSLRYLGDYGATETVVPLPEPLPTVPAEGTVRFSAGGLAIEIRGEPCEDVMSGEAFSHAVTVRAGDRVVEGCGRRP